MNNTSIPTFVNSDTSSDELDDGSSERIEYTNPSSSYMIRNRTLDNEQDYDDLLSWIDSVQSRMKCRFKAQTKEAKKFQRKLHLKRLREKYRNDPLDYNFQKLSNIIHKESHNLAIDSNDQKRTTEKSISESIREKGLDMSDSSEEKEREQQIEKDTDENEKNISEIDFDINNKDTESASEIELLDTDEEGSANSSIHHNTYSSEIEIIDETEVELASQSASGSEVNIRKASIDDDVSLKSVSEESDSLSSTDSQQVNIMKQDESINSSDPDNTEHSILEDSSNLHYFSNQVNSEEGELRSIETDTKLNNTILLYPDSHANNHFVSNDSEASFLEKMSPEKIQESFGRHDRHESTSPLKTEVHVGSPQFNVSENLNENEYISSDKSPDIFFSRNSDSSVVDYSEQEYTEQEEYSYGKEEHVNDFRIKNSIVEKSMTKSRSSELFDESRNIESVEEYEEGYSDIESSSLSKLDADSNASSDNEAFKDQNVQDIYNVAVSAVQTMAEEEKKFLNRTSISSQNIAEGEELDGSNKDGYFYSEDRTSPENVLGDHDNSQIKDSKDSDPDFNKSSEFNSSENGEPPKFDEATGTSYEKEPPETNCSYSCDSIIASMESSPDDVVTNRLEDTRMSDSTDKNPEATETLNMVEDEPSVSDFSQDFLDMDVVPRFKTIEEEDKDSIIANLEKAQERFKVSLTSLERLTGNMNLKSERQATQDINMGDEVPPINSLIDEIKDTIPISSIERPILQEIEDESSSDTYSNNSETDEAGDINEYLSNRHKTNLKFGLTQKYDDINFAQSAVNLKGRLEKTDEDEGLKYDSSSDINLNNYGQFYDESDSSIQKRKMTECVDFEEVEIDDADAFVSEYENTEVQICNFGISLYPTTIYEPEERINSFHEKLSSLNYEIEEDINSPDHAGLEPSSIIEPPDSLYQLVSEMSSCDSLEAENLFPSSITEVELHNKVQGEANDFLNDSPRPKKRLYHEVLSNFESNVIKKIKKSFSFLRHLEQFLSHSPHIDTPKLQSIDGELEEKFYTLKTAPENSSDERKKNQIESNAESPFGLRKQEMIFFSPNETMLFGRSVHDVNNSNNTTKYSNRNSSPNYASDSSENEQLQVNYAHNVSESPTRSRGRPRGPSKYLGLGTPVKEAEAPRRLRSGNQYGADIDNKRTDTKSKKNNLSITKRYRKLKPPSNAFPPSSRTRSKSPLKFSNNNNIKTQSNPCSDEESTMSQRTRSHDKRNKNT